MDKQHLKQTIKEWVKLDEDVAELKLKIKAMNQRKKEMSLHLLEIMKEQKIDAFDLNNEGKLVRQMKKTKQPINKKQLTTSLTKYYESENEAQKVTEYILNARQERTDESICKK
jgi:hypothetical protein